MTAMDKTHEAHKRRVDNAAGALIIGAKIAVTTKITVAKPKGRMMATFDGLRISHRTINGPMANASKKVMAQDALIT